MSDAHIIVVYRFIGWGKMKTPARREMTERKPGYIPVPRWHW